MPTNENREWSTTGPNILAPDQLANIERALEQAPIIVEHRHYYGSRAPDRLIFEEYEDVVTYLKTHARPGDKFYVWNYGELCRDDNPVASGKYPDAQGRTPRGGAY
jgi:hypothetical protein